MKDNVPLLAFNRGLISKLALARTDIKRLALSCEIQRNWMPRVLGSTMLRPGFGFINNTNDNQKAVHLPFVFSSDDTAIIELTDGMMRVYVNDTIISRVSVATTISNGDFGSATNWTDADEAGATSTITGGKLNLNGTGFNAAIRRQTVTVAGGDQAKEHALRITVDRGPVTFRIGTTAGGDEIIQQTTLGTGLHSLSFTPNTGTIYVQFSAINAYTAIVDSCVIESAGEMEIAAPWDELDLSMIRWDQSADIIYCACNGYAPYKIERRSTTSWSIVQYLPEDGPFRNANLSTTQISASGLTGDITLTASRPLFKSGQVGALYKINSIGQTVNASLNGADQFTGYIRITGVSSSRQYSYTISGTWSGTITRQVSYATPDSWTDIGNFTSNTSNTTTETEDNTIAFIRFGFKAGNFTSGSATIVITYASGSIAGIVRITAIASSTSASAVVISPLGGTTAVSNWTEGQWSSYRGYPSAVALYEGRLFWAGKSKIWGSVSDAYESFNGTLTGDSRSINRSIGSGPIDDINWLMPLNRLVIGTAGTEWVARSSSFDEPLTVDNFNLKSPSTQGSISVNPVKVDTKGIFVNKSGNKLFQMVYNGDTSFDYESIDMMELAPEVGKPSITRLTVQRQPDTRVHAVRADGLVAVLISQPAEEVLCWVEVETLGAVEDCFVMPGPIEDLVYYVVRRTVGGVTKRFLEKWALESECQGGALNKQADCFVTYTGTATATLSVPHLIGEEVIVWADGKDFSPGEFANQTTYTVAGDGTITLPEAVTNAVIGLPYSAPMKSSKLAYAAQLSTALGQQKRIDHMGLIMSNTHHKGLKYGQKIDINDPTKSQLDNIPEIINDIPIAADTIFEDMDTGMFEFAGDWSTDSRLCLLAHAPRPCTLLAAIVGMKTNG